MNNGTDTLVIGVGFDTARYGHHVSFLRPDSQPAAKAFTFAESPAGYEQLRQALDKLRQTNESVHFHIRIDAAGLYAVNLERFLRALPWPKTISVGQPKQNRDYRNVHFPKRKADAVDSQACARFAIVERPAATPETPAAFLQLREIVSAIEAQAGQTTRLKNQLHNRLARVFPELALETSDLSASWVLRLLAKYPTPAKIAAARPASLTAIPHVKEENARAIQAAARQTVASLGGPVAEGLIRESVQAIRHGQKRTRTLMGLLEQAHDALPTGPHRRIETITGIGKQTAAALVAKMVHIDRFATPEAVVNYFGVFPEENSSGVDRWGRPAPRGATRMSPKGNDLVRRCLWNAAKTAIQHNPPVRALYARQRAAGKRGDVALGHCMRKLLHQVFAVWKTDTDFDPDRTPSQSRPAAANNAEGRKGRCPERQAVTPTPSTIPAGSPASNRSASAPAAGGGCANG